MNYYPYKEQFYLDSNYIFDAEDILADGGIIQQGSGEGIAYTGYDFKGSRRSRKGGI